ncbi:hypothetical protein QYE76_041862 [Lolium multiflorum]|uniref:Transposase (putative) gypsy type domain-containing protein n=1 Tax=Lolium multiflorum TaxID=4521 RepID=A0AAD8TFU1_LOLMU|nr:hypothetical protein QYE76_041862 [Lolium multiflorum]
MAAADLGAAEWERSKITNQDLNLLKKLGISKKPKAVCFPSEESYPTPPMGYRVSFVDHLIRGLSAPIHPFLRGLLFVYGLQLHHLTPNSILHISIFITLCEAFLGVQPNWALWKRIFFCRRNGSANVAYNIGGVVISVRSSVNYFDVKLPDSVQGWRKKWLYIREENHGCAEDNIPPFDGAEKILRRRSWDAEATEEERISTEALMTRIHELQNTRGKELSGIQITAYFLRTRVQPLQARKNPFWNYAGDEDTDRLSTNLEVKDLDRLIRKISSLKKKDPIPSTYRVKPYSATNALPKEGASEATASAQSPPPAVSPKNKRKRNDAEDSGTSKPEEAVPSRQKAAYDPYLETLISSDDEEEVPTADVAARTSTSHTLVASETPVEGEETSPPQQNVGTATPPSSPLVPSPKRARVETIPEPTLQLSSSSNPLLDDPMIKELLRIGAQFIGYRDYASKTEEKLAEVNERANTLAQKLEQSEEARKKAESDAVEARREADKAKADAAGVEDLRKRLHDAETSLSDHIAAQIAREEAITKRIRTQNRRFVNKTSQEFELEDPDNDPLLDAVSFLEFHGTEAREGIDEARTGLSRLFPYFFPKKEEPATFLALAKSNVDPNNVPLASLVAQEEENVDVNFIKNNNFNNNAYRNNSGNNYRPYPSANGNGYGNSYGNSYNNNRSVPSGLEAMLKEFISTQTAFNKSVEEKLDKIDTIASRVDRLASDVNLLKLKVMPNNDIDNKITTTANAIQVRINENIRLMAELRARWDREENEKLAKENNVAKVWTITTTSNANSPHVAAPPTINGNIIGVGNVSTPSAKRTKLPEIAKTAEIACDKTAEIFSNLGNDDPIAVAHNDLDFDDCHISEVIKFLQKLAKSPNASAINLAFTKHITNALIKAREEKLKLETSIPRKLEDGWEPIIKMKFNDFECNALCDLGASISVMPKKIYDMLDLPPLKNCYLDVNLADNVKKKPLGRIDNVHITVNNNLVPVDFVVLDIECNASCPIVLGRPFLRTVGAVIDMREGNIKYQFPLKKGMEHFPRKRMKLPFDSIIRTSYDVDASTLDVT